MKTHRPSWHVYFGEIATQVATRSTCTRKNVGCVIVRDKNILSTGYNGSIKNTKHCTEIGCLIENSHCVRTIHAEQNAIVQAAKNGIRIQDADLYVTSSPCYTCFKLIANAGIKNIYYLEFYRDDRIIDLSKSLGISLIDLSFLDKLTKFAKTNGMISNSEKLILERFQINFEEFNHILIGISNEGILDDISRAKLDLIKEKITEIVGQDISDDGVRLIDEITRLLNSIPELKN